jgi:D-alanine-D-alanine ligase
MRIGIAFDLKTETPAGVLPVPDDLQEEFDSPATIEAIACVLRDLGHEVQWLGDGRPLLERLLADPPDFVFNLAEGHGVGRSREARVPAVLEMLGIPYSGSDPLTLAATLDKDCARRLVASVGLVVPEGIVLGPGDDVGLLARRVSFPAIAKPTWEGSSKGIRNKCLVHAPAELEDIVETLRRDHCQPILVEEYIAGDEVTVGIVGNELPEIMGIMRVFPKQPTDRFVYSLEVKRDFRKLVSYECPARLSPADTEAVQWAALTAYRCLGCRDVSRVDFRLRQGVPYFLEVNPLPGLNPQTSDLVIMADLVGWTHAQLIQRILDAALDRHRIRKKGQAPQGPPRQVVPDSLFGCPLS